jgi:hypothetical protein
MPTSTSPCCPSRPCLAQKLNKVYSRNYKIYRNFPKFNEIYLLERCVGVVTMIDRDTDIAVRVTAKVVLCVVNMDGQGPTRFLVDLGHNCDEFKH